MYMMLDYTILASYVDIVIDVYTAYKIGEDQPFNTA